MADVKISALPAATLPLDQDELLETVQDGVNKKVAIGSLFASYLGHTLVYTGDVLDRVDCFLDAAKTQLHRKFTMVRTSGKITSVEVRNAADTLVETILLSYTGNKLLGATRI